MGEGELVFKIEHLLKGSLPLEHEPFAVYLMVEIRKLFERYKVERGQTLPFPVLNFYANWVVHTAKNDNVEIREVMRKIFMEITQSQQKQSDVLNRFVGMVHLRIQIQGFLEYFQVKGEALLTDAAWNIFRDSLARVLVDQPILSPIPEIREFRFLTDHNAGLVCRMIFSVAGQDDVIVRV
jgi:hypothetical protein